MSTLSVGGPSTAAVDGPSFPFPGPGLPVPPTVIEDLSTRLGNLEYRHGVLMRKVEEVSDAEVADSIAIREIHPRVATVEEQMAVPRQDVIVRLSQQVQTLQTALHGAELQNQELQTKVAEMESHEGNISYLSNYEPFDEGYVSFGQGGCKITGKGQRIGNSSRMVTSVSIMRENKPSSQRLKSNGVEAELREYSGLIFATGGALSNETGRATFISIFDIGNYFDHDIDE
nr:hypothetical protein [Tanacetum cinerariifolium]